MPCGVETTKRIAETIRQSDRPLTVIEICRILGFPRSTIRDGLNNILETGTPQMSVKPVRIPGRKGRPEMSYAIRKDSEHTFTTPQWVKKEVLSVLAKNFK